jgi:hypothetical protein
VLKIISHIINHTVLAIYFWGSDPNTHLYVAICIKKFVKKRI